MSADIARQVVRGYCRSMRRVFRTPRSCVIAAAVYQLPILVALGGIFDSSMPETAITALATAVIVVGEAGAVRAGMARVVVTPEGIRQHYVLRNRFVPWSEIESIGLWDDERSGVVGVVPVTINIYCPIVYLRPRFLRLVGSYRLLALTKYSWVSGRPASPRIVEIIGELEQLRQRFCPPPEPLRPRRQPIVSGRAGGRRRRWRSQRRLAGGGSRPAA